MKDCNFPDDVKKHFYNVLNEEREYIGEKKIERGFIIKKNKDRATITYDNGHAIYAAKLIKSNNEDWKVVGVPSIWENLKDLLETN